MGARAIEGIAFPRPYKFTGLGEYFWRNQYGAQAGLLPLPENAPEFILNLKKSIVPEEGTGSPTYTRATTAYVTDFEGLQKQVPSGCARFTGARFVFNQLNASENNTVTNGGPSSNCTVTATTVRPYAASAFNYMRSSTYPAKIGVARARVKLSSTDGKLTIGLRIVANGTGVAQISVPLTTIPTIYTISVNTNLSTTSVDVGLDNRISQGGDETTTGTIIATEWQLEDVTGQTNQNPSEYVSVGVLSAPYHGAGVDGVKYFDTENGNTVASNVVTEATGAVIADATLDGYLAEGSRQNISTQSQLNSGWADDGAVLTRNNAVAPDGTITAGLLTESAGTSAHREYQGSGATITGGTTVTASIFVKAGTNTRATIFMLNGTLLRGCYASFNLSTASLITTGVVGTGTVSGSSIFALSNGWYRISVTGTLNSVDETADLAVGSCDESGAFSYAGSAGNTMWVWGGQIEQASFASSYIPTTTAAVTRNASVISYPSSGNIAAAAGTIYLEFTPQHAPIGTIALFGSYVDANNYTAILHDATNLIFRKRVAASNYDATIANAFVAGTTYKVAASWGSGGTSIVLGGTVGTPHANTTNAQIGTTIQIGADGNGAQQPFASIKNPKIWQTAKTDAQLQALTT